MDNKTEKYTDATGTYTVAHLSTNYYCHMYASTLCGSVMLIVFVCSIFSLVLCGRLSLLPVSF